MSKCGSSSSPLASLSHILDKANAQERHLGTDTVLDPVCASDCLCFCDPHRPGIHGLLEVPERLVSPLRGHRGLPQFLPVETLLL